MGVSFFVFKTKQNKTKECFPSFTGIIAPKQAHVCVCFLAEEQPGEEVVTGAVCQGGFGGVEESLKIMGKSNSKLKPEVVEELTRKTYCEYLHVFFFVLVF